MRLSVYSKVFLPRAWGCRGRSSLPHGSGADSFVAFCCAPPSPRRSTGQGGATLVPLEQGTAGRRPGGCTRLKGNSVLPIAFWIGNRERRQEGTRETGRVGGGRRLATEWGPKERGGSGTSLVMVSAGTCVDWSDPSKTDNSLLGTSTFGGPPLCLCCLHTSGSPAPAPPQATSAEVPRRRGRLGRVPSIQNIV